MAKGNETLRPSAGLVLLLLLAGGAMSAAIGITYGAGPGAFTFAQGIMWTLITGAGTYLVLIGSWPLLSGLRPTSDPQTASDIALPLSERDEAMGEVRHARAGVLEETI